MSFPLEKNEIPLRHIPALDGVRGLAVLLVCLFHFGNLPLGWVGVDLFFVLSGFLITSILLQQRGAPHYFRNFYIRRALRIFPLYYLLIICFFWVMLPLAGHYGWIRDLTAPQWQTSQLWYWTYLSNWKSAWGPLAISPVGHVWSLSIEEQFYLVWPLVVLVAGPVRLTRVSIMIIVAATAARILVAVWCNNMPGELVYRLTIFRVDALAYGSLIASTALPLRKVALASAGLGCVLVVIACSYSFRYSSPAMYTIGFTGFDLLAFTLVLGAYRTNHHILRNRLLTSWGKYSYAIYIFHVPINFMLSWKVTSQMHSAFQRTFVSLAVGMPLSYLGARLSWRIIEHPLLQLKDRFAPYTKISAISSSPSSPVPQDFD